MGHRNPGERRANRDARAGLGHHHRPMSDLVATVAPPFTLCWLAATRPACALREGGSVPGSSRPIHRALGVVKVRAAAHRLAARWP